LSAAPPQLFGGATAPKAPVKTPQVKARHSKTNLPRAHIPVALHDPVNPPQLNYNSGPFELPTEEYEWRLWARRTDLKILTLDELETIQWDDAAALMTGSVTLREPEWAHEYGIIDGNQVVCEWRRFGGAWQGLWTMRVMTPTKTYETKQRTFQLANDLQRLVDSTDTFKFTTTTKTGGWRTDEIITFIFAAYGIEIAPGGLPKMAAVVTNWTAIDQRPLDVVHSALTREKNVTGIKYALRLDGQGRAVITPFTRPRNLYQLGATLIAAAYSVTRNPRFATAVTVRAETTRTATDASGHAKVQTSGINVSVSSPGGVKRYGFIHRNVYSPDATSTKTANDEGAMFLASVGRPVQQFQVSMRGMPELRRLNAIRFVLPAEHVSQLVYVTDANHSVTGNGYTTDVTLAFDDPYTDRIADRITAKLSDAAIIRSGTAAAATPGSTVKAPKPPHAAARATAPQLFGGPTDPPPKKTGTR
jgi:hypothetical protein